MNQPTREEFDALKAQVQRIEQATEPMHVTRIELDPGGIQNRLDNHAEMMKELSQQSDLHTQAFIRVETLLNEHGRLLNEQGRLLNEQGRRFEVLAQEMIKGQMEVVDFRLEMQKRTDAIAEVQKLILDRLPE